MKWASEDDDEGQTMTGDLRCWCGRRTPVYVSSERGIADTGKVETRICPVHGEGWREDPALTVTPSD